VEGLGRTVLVIERIGITSMARAILVKKTGPSFYDRHRIRINLARFRNRTHLAVGQKSFEMSGYIPFCMNVHRDVEGLTGG